MHIFCITTQYIVFQQYYQQNQGMNNLMTVDPVAAIKSNIAVQQQQQVYPNQVIIHIARVPLKLYASGLDYSIHSCLVLLVHVGNKICAHTSITHFFVKVSALWYLGCLVHIWVREHLICVRSLLKSFFLPVCASFAWMWSTRARVFLILETIFLFVLGFFCLKYHWIWAFPFKIVRTGQKIGMSLEPGEPLTEASLGQRVRFQKNFERGGQDVSQNLELVGRRELCWIAIGLGVRICSSPRHDFT